MTSNKIVVAIVVSVVALLLCISTTNHESPTPSLRRKLQLTLDPFSSVLKATQKYQTVAGRYGTTMEIRNHDLDFDSFLLEGDSSTKPSSASQQQRNEWCSPPQLPPLPYETCNEQAPILGVPLLGGLTNGLKFVLLDAIKAIENGNQCFYIQESEDGPFPTQFGPFLNLFLEGPIGLDPQSDIVQRAIHENRVEPMSWLTVWDDLYARRSQDTVHDIPALGYRSAEGHDLKRNFMRRLWRPLPAVREAACSTLEGRHGLVNNDQNQDYIALSIRQGDKTIEGFGFATMQQYIDKVEELVPTQFGGTVPRIFVATDTCAPLGELRAIRPDWTFVSECDYIQQHGYDVDDNKKWNRDELLQHYSKFFVELFAMAHAKVWIGVSYTNVAWFVYFMRSREAANNFYILETEGADKAVPWGW